MRLAIAQIRSTDDPWENLLQVQNFYLEAVREKAQLVCFPENTFFRGPQFKGSFPRSESHLFVKRNDRNSVTMLDGGSAFSDEVRHFLSQVEIPVSLGSVLEVAQSEDKPSNSHWIAYPNGQIVSYQKIHLFHFSSPTAQYRESDDVVAGKEAVATDIAGVSTGLSICFDLRFSELYRRLTLKHKTELLLVPAAFTYETGEKHWHALLRARAIENLSFVAATGQWGAHKNAAGQELFCYGNSVIYDPWGDTVALAPTAGDCLLVADLDFEKVKKYRAQLPALEAAVLL